MKKSIRYIWLNLISKSGDIDVKEIEYEVMKFMNIGISNLTNYAKSYINQQNRTVGQNSRVDFNSVLSAKKIENTGTTKVDEYTEYIKSKYGTSMIVKDVGRNQKSIDDIGAGTCGTGNVVIASNILEEMANDLEKASYYEAKIQNYFDSVPKYQAELSAMGHEIHSSGIVIHPDGTVTHYISGDLKPEVRAKIEAKIKAEKEEKEKRRSEYLERSQEAAEKSRQIEDSNLKQQILNEALNRQAQTLDMMDIEW